MPRAKLTILALGATALMQVGLAAAQDSAGPALVLAGDSLLLEALGHRFAIPRPSWTDPEAVDLTGLVETSFVSNQTDAVLEIFPRHEGEGFWTTRYGVHISRTAELSLSAYRDIVIAGYASTCKPELTGFFQFGEDAGETLAPLGFVCGAHRDGLLGYSGKAEIMVMSFRRTDAGAGMVYQEWRGEPFDPSKPATWPVATDTVEAQAELLQQAATLTLVD